MKKLPVLITSFALLSTAAQAGVVFQSGDWKLDDSIPGDPSKGICQAMTAGYMGSAVVYLSLVVDKTGARPLEVMLIPNRPSVGASAMYARSESGATFYLPKLVRSGDKDMYWNIPTNTAKFIEDLKAGSQIQFRAVSGTQEQLPLSLSGSTAVINKLQERCTKNSLFTAREFEKAFLPENFDRFQIRNITPEKASKLRDLIREAIPFYLKLRGIQGELAALEAKFKALVTERNTLRTDLDRLKNVEIPNLTNARDAAQAKIDKATAEIADLTNQIAAKQAELVEAKRIADAAYERLRPLIPEHDRLLNIVRSDERRLGAARENLSEIDSGIARNQQIISDLNREADSLNGALPRAQDEVRRGQYGLDEAQRAYQAFEPRREIHQRMQSNHRVRQLEHEMRQLEGQMQGYQAQVQQAQGMVQAYQQQVNAANQALQSCRAGRAPIASLELAGRFLADESNGPRRPGWGGPNGPGRPGDGPGRPHPPGPGPGPGPRPPGPGPQPPVPPTPPPPQPPVPPTPPPPPNCSAQEAALANAQAQLNAAIGQLNQAQANLNNAQGQLQRARGEFHQIRQQIEWQVRREQEQFAARVTEWQNFLSQAQGNLARIQDRLNNIIRYDLPRAQNELSNLESRRPGAVAELQNAESALSNSTAAFNNYKRSVDYDNIRNEANRTAAVVRGIESTIAEFQRGVASRQALIREQTRLRDSLIQRIADTNALIAKKEARLVEVDAALAAYDTQKAEIMGRLNAAAAELKVYTDQYAAQLN